MTSRLSLAIAIDEPSQIGAARRRAVQLARECGFDEIAAGNVALVVNELATNLAKHATRGELVISWDSATLEQCELEILSIDHGPGIADVERCLADGFSTSGTSGNGLGAVRRLSSSWDIYSQRGVGTVQMARVGNGTGAVGDVPVMRIAGISIPMTGEIECGDAWLSLSTDSGCRILVADGLGHGPQAALAAREAVQALADHPLATPAEVLRAAHETLRATRGAAVSMAEFDPEKNLLRYAGIGNIAAFISTAGRSQNMVSINGTMGALSPKVKEFVYPAVPGATVVFYSDGLTSQVRLDGYPGLTAHDPAIVAGILYRDFNRRRDDVTVVVAMVS